MENGFWMKSTPSWAIMFGRAQQAAEAPAVDARHIEVGNDQDERASAIHGQKGRVRALKRSDLQFYRSEQSRQENALGRIVVDHDGGARHQF